MSLATNGQDYPNTELFAESQPAKPGECGEVYHTRHDKETKSQWWERPDGKTKWLSRGTPGK